MHIVLNKGTVISDVYDPLNVRFFIKIYPMIFDFKHNEISCMIVYFLTYIHIVNFFTHNLFHNIPRGLNNFLYKNIITTSNFHGGHIKPNS